MSTQTLPSIGQHWARKHWGTQASGAAFDRKKTPYLTERAQEFIAQQSMCVIVGLNPYNELDGVLVMEQPGFVQILDESTCLLRLEDRSRASGILRRLHRARSTGEVTWLGLLFICHPTRERLCVQGTVEILANTSSSILYSSSSTTSVVIRLHIREAFFHCSKYIRTRIPGLTVPGSPPSQQIKIPQHLLKGSQRALSEEHCRFLSQQALCFLCTVNRDGQCAINHRGGAPGFLVPFLPDEASPGGIVLLSDFAGNGAFEAIGNILETEKAAIVVPDYAAQVALCLSGAACVVEPEDLRVEVARRCVGAQRIIALAVRRVEVQKGDWSVTLVYERMHASSIWTNTSTLAACALN
ncbi:MAG TPA: pyridoxamine 5'-phosphate oxidase family protein [Ktedonobacteraceae bacterium]|nr:pyridoxamine 5'-phosphate oxidase family protein [Ktedonobacteraceae bacterium]